MGFPQLHPPADHDGLHVASSPGAELAPKGLLRAYRVVSRVYRYQNRPFRHCFFVPSSNVMALGTRLVSVCEEPGLHLLQSPQRLL